MEERVIIVDIENNPLGTEEKLEAHRKALLHRAVSVVILDSKNDRMLLQKRADTKYHCPGIWANACCTHPRPQESAVDAASRRLKEEMGFSCSLREVFDFTYKAEFDNGLWEHEFDHVFIGRYDGPIMPNPEEVSEYRWENIDALREDMEEFPDRYAVWFREIIRVMDNKDML